MIFFSSANRVLSDIAIHWLQEACVTDHVSSRLKWITAFVLRVSRKYLFS